MQIGFSDAFINYMAAFVVLASVMMVMARSPRWGFFLMGVTVISTIAYSGGVAAIVSGAMPPFALILIAVSRAWKRRYSR